MPIAKREETSVHFDWNDPYSCRMASRKQEYSGCTSGLAPDRVQGNLAILPEEYATSFLIFCQRNPQPCPLIYAGAPGQWLLDSLGRDLDIRSDLPSYRVFRDGEYIEDRPDIRDLWRDDLVAFVLGCSLSFEQALRTAGLPLAQPEKGSDRPCYNSAIETQASGPFRGGMVVSMRAFSPVNAIRAIQITTRFPRVHGAPVHLGSPEAIGIKDLGKPDYGDPVEVREDEIPLFWGCGITPQVAIRNAKIPFAITHTPGHMLITDRYNEALAVL